MPRRKAGHPAPSSGQKTGKRSGGQSQQPTKTGQKIATLKKDICIIVMGRPALKKNSRDIGFAGHGAKRKFIPLQSKSYREALVTHVPQIKKQWKLKNPVGSKEQPLHIQSLFYAGKGVEPDLDGAMVGLGDLLQKSGVVSNDRWIKSWDGSRVIPYSEHQSEPKTVMVIKRFVR